MTRLIPGKTKVQIELFKGVTLADILVGTIAFIAMVFVIISSLPFKVYIVIGLLAVTALLLVRLDTQPNYLYLLHILRHFGYNRAYGRVIGDDLLTADEETANEMAFSEVFKEEEEDPYAGETKKERKKRLKAEKKQRKREDKILKSKKASEEEKAEIRARRAVEAEKAAKRLAAAREAAAKRHSVSRIMPYTAIKDGYIEYGGEYFGAVLEIPAVDFRFFSEHRRRNSIENGLGKILRSINPNYAANIVKIERPMQYDAFLELEQQKLDGLRKSYEQGIITEDELKIRTEIMYHRIDEIEHLCSDEKVIEPFYYLVLYESDKRQLENQVSNAVSSLLSGEMKPRRLNTKELAVFLKYTNQLDFDEHDVDKVDPEQYAAWAMPEMVRVKGRTVELNNIISHNLRIVNYPTVVGDAWLAGVFSMPGTKCVVKCRPMDRTKSIRSIDRSLQELRGQYMNTSVDSKLIEIQNHIDTLGELLAMLQQDNESLLEVNIYVTAYDYTATAASPALPTPENSDLPRVPNMKKVVRRSYMEAGMRLNNMEFDQMQAFIGSQISAWDPMHAQSRGIPSNSLAAIYPWIYASISDVGGIQLGRSEGVPVFIDFFRRDSERVNSNMVIVGKSGSGKSYATKSLLANLAAEDSKIFILDPENEYTVLAANLHGKFINVGNAQNGRLNPFHIITALDDDESEGVGVSSSYATHLQFLEEFFRQILPDCDKDAMEYLNSLIDRMYTNHGITADTDLSKLKPEDYPIFDDLYDAILMEFQQTDNEYIRSILRILMNYVAKFSAGGRNATLWNGPSTVTTEENFIVFNFQSLLANRNSTIANAQMLLVLKYIDNEIIKNRDYNNKYNLKRKVVVAIDEAHVFIDTKFPIALDFMFQLAKRIRKYNGMQIVITQNIKDFVGSEEIERKSTAIINACQYSFIFSLAPNDMTDLCTLYEKAGGINEQEQEKITTAPRGQAFTIMSPTSRTNFQVAVQNDIVAISKEVNFRSRYFSGEGGEENWAEFLGESADIRAENLDLPVEVEAESPDTAAQEKTHLTFMEFDEDEFFEQRMQEMREEQQKKEKEKSFLFFEEVEDITPASLAGAGSSSGGVEFFEFTEEEMAAAAPAAAVAPAPAAGAPAAHTGEMVQMMSDVLSKFSYDAMLEEIRRSVRSELERELSVRPAPAEQAAAFVPPVVPVPQESAAEFVMPAFEETVLPAEESAAAVEMPDFTPAAEEPVVESAPVAAESPAAMEDIFVMPDFTENAAPTESEEEEDDDTEGFDIMALLAEQAEKMKDISPIDMMETYDEKVIDISLDELAQYVRKMFVR